MATTNMVQGTLIPLPPEMLPNVKKFAVKKSEVKQCKEFVNLTNGLAELAAALQGTEARQERELRPKVIEAAILFHHSHYQLGDALLQYRAHWKPRGAWMAVCKLIAREMTVSLSTLLRIVDDFERVSPLTDATQTAFRAEGLDPVARKNQSILEAAKAYIADSPKASVDDIREAVKNARLSSNPRKQRECLSREERQVFAVREHLRKSLDRVPAQDRVKVLQEAISGLAEQILGKTTPFTLRVTPSTEPEAGRHEPMSILSAA